jgi:hypothetical protein
MKMKTQILKLNKAGTPIEWVGFEDAAISIAKGQMLWSMGGLETTLRGGTSRVTGLRSTMDVPPIIAVSGQVWTPTVPGVSNQLLFARDRHTCMYCGDVYHKNQLSRDHVVPTSKGGLDTWTNVVCCCKRCNHSKGDLSVKAWGHQLLAVPYAPNLNEWFYLSGKSVVADQMDYLKGGFRNLHIT